MNPQKTLKMIVESCHDLDWEVCSMAIESLMNWIDDYGYAPMIDSKSLRTILGLALCRVNTLQQSKTS